MTKSFSLLALVLLLLSACADRHNQVSEEGEDHSPSKAGEALRTWAMARLFPDGHFHTEQYAEALTQMRLEASLRSGFNNTWEALGPKNIGGRTLCLAVNPLDTNILYAGSASGGIWKSTTAGRGATAWMRLETGFPVLGVSAIALDPANPDVVYAGTGEVYNVENSAPNVAFRTTRGTYGIGILKSTDGGQSWSHSLDWTYGDLRGVQDIKINPLRPATLFAATTEGLLRSRDAGASWQTVHAQPMAVDIEINPLDTNIIFVTHGSLNDDAVSGVYRSVDGGDSFEKLTNGLPESYSGKTLLGLCHNQPNIVYASVANDFNQQGLYRSEDDGDSWELANPTDVCTYQGWYSHDVAVHPNNPDMFIWTGIDAWLSTDGGASVDKKTYWAAWYFGQTIAGEPEGPPHYVHADIHRAYWLDNDPNKVYVVTDGGIFVSYDGGTNWEGRNGGYQTQQFYANFGNSATNPNLGIGGMQDNSTAIFTGTGNWTRVLGGDGECAAIHPLDDQIMYGSSQYLNLRKSINGGQSFYGISPGWNGEATAFNGPFELAPSDPNILYAGAQSLWRSDDGGETWNTATQNLFADGDFIVNIAVHPANPDIVYCSTAPAQTATARVFKVTANAPFVTELTGLPNRMCMDIAWHPTNYNIAYAVFAGFGAPHVWRTTDSGASWQAIDNGLPDVPTNTILVDPLLPDHLYVGNDLGIWLSTDAGASWSLYSADAPNAMLVMHLSEAPDRKLRVATYGLGVWQTEMQGSVGTQELSFEPSVSLAPNPAAELTTLRFTLPDEAVVSWQVVDIQGKMVFQSSRGKRAAGDYSESLDLHNLPAGTYGVVLEGKIKGKQFRVARVLSKQK